MDVTNQTAICQINATNKNLISNIDENAKNYEITSSSDFSDFYRMLFEGNTFAGYTVILTKDISFETEEKTGQRIFEGKFEGQGHKISDIRHCPKFCVNGNRIQL